jgi:hypothetical protein
VVVKVVEHDAVWLHGWGFRSGRRGAIVRIPGGIGLLCPVAIG